MTMPDLMMNVHTCVTDNTAYTMVYGRSLEQIYCPSDNTIWFNDECTHIFYWEHYLHHGVWQITITDLLIKVHTCGPDNTP